MGLDLETWAPDRVVNLVHHRIMTNATEDNRERLEEALQASEDAWREYERPEGTADRPTGAPAWWSEEEAGAETWGSSKALAGLGGVKR